MTQSAEKLNIPLGVICIEQAENLGLATYGQIPPESASIMYRGRAADKLASNATLYPSALWVECPHEDLTNPGRVHIDPFGNMHICQGLSIGNLLSTSIKYICHNFDPPNHPIIGPLLEGGPFKLVERYHLITNDAYADACQLCYEARKMLRGQYPEVLLPDQMYGVVS